MEVPFSRSLSLSHLKLHPLSLSLSVSLSWPKSLYCLNSHSSFHRLLPKNRPMLPIPSFFSPVALWQTYLRRCFVASGLSPRAIEVDPDAQTTVHFWAPTGGPDPRKPSLLLVHGFGPIAVWQWRKQVQFFAPHFNVYVPDLLFFGHSTTASSERSEAFQVNFAFFMSRLSYTQDSILSFDYRLIQQFFSSAIFDIVVPLECSFRQESSYHTCNLSMHIDSVLGLAYEL